MRQIERNMLQAVRTGRDWQEGNTAVSKVAACEMAVFLHGHRIASFDSRTGEVHACIGTFRNWPTRTTCSRLRALGIDASIKQGLPCIDGEPI